MNLSEPIQSFPDFPDDAFIVKYDAAGNAKWANLIGGYKGIGTDIAVSPFNKDAFVATYNSAGVLLKARRIGGGLDDGGSGIAYDHQGNLYVTGVFQATIDVDGQSLIGEKPFNLFVLKFKSENGKLDWAKKADGPGQNNFEANLRMSVTPDGNVFVTGAYQDTAVFDAVTLHSAGDFDIFLAELNANPDDDNCKGQRCGEQDDDNRRDH